MRVGVIGISFKTASLEIREQLACICQSIANSENLLSHNSQMKSCIVLNTCNRTEIYFSGDGLARVHSYILSYLRRFISLDFEHLLYSYFGFDCFLHLAKVTSGVDSAVFGETEIQGQVKKSYEENREKRKLCSEMHYLFQKSLMIGKSIRYSYLLSDEALSFEGLFWKELEKSVSPGCSILFIGASQVNAKLLKSRPKDVGVSCFLTNRTKCKGLKFIDAFAGVKWATWSEVTQWKKYAAIIVGTSSREYILKKDLTSLNALNHKIALFDLSLPRNIDPELSADSQISLSNIDDLHRKVMGIQKTHEGNLSKVHEEVTEDVRKKYSIFHTKQKRVLLSDFAEASI